jgi:hypothetical protein
MAASEQKKSYAVIKNFTGLNTKANRTAIREEEFAWLENAMPIGFGSIRIVPAQTAVTDTGNAVAFSNTVTLLTSVNVNNKDYILGFQDNGAAQYVEMTGASTGTRGNIASSGTFSTANVSAAQYSNERVMIGDPNKGLFTWNGNTLVGIGSVGLIAVTNPGSGYTFPPTVTLSAPNDANGVQATATATISTSAGGIAAITITNEGSGYAYVPTVIIGPPNDAGGIQARAVATILSSKVSAITIVESGSGYTTAPTVSIIGGGGTGANAAANLASGIVNSVFVTNAGSGYTTPPTVTFFDGSGTNAAAVAELVTFEKGTVTVFVTNGGNGYTSTPTVTISGGGGANANAIAIVQGGEVVSIITNQHGNGYTSNPTVTITGGGGNNATANAIALLDEVVDVATFGGRTWVAYGRTIAWSAAGTYNDFTGVSAGSLTLTDSTLHGNIRAIYSANNFLYIFGDDSINVISDLRVDSTGQTLFTNTNVSASVGTKRIYAIFPYFRSMLFMNDYGIYALVGSTTSKLSDQLDGIFPLIDFTQPVSGGQVLIFNILCAAFSFTYTDAVLGARQVQAVFFERKWFLTQQGALSYVTSAPVGGSINLYGDIDKTLYRLYANSSASISSTVKTALLPMGDNIRTKQALKFGIEATLANSATLTVTVDSESGSSPSYTVQNAVSWLNNSGQVIPWVNNSSLTVVWLYSSGYALYKSDAQQYGKYLGLTVTSTNPNFTYNTFEFEHELRVRF